MKAAVVYGKDDIRIEEVETPTPGPGEIVLKLKASGVCATDVKILGGAGLPKELPIILGHEGAGIIDAVGEGVSGLETGQRVAVYPVAACGVCFFCKKGRHSLCTDQFGLGHGIDGAFAEYVKVPERIIKLGGVVDIGDMPFDLAAMIEPTGCCIAASRHCRTSAGDTVAVIGCGPLGQLHTIVSKALSARVIAIDLNEDRLAAAKESGADILLNPDKVDVIEEVMSITEVGADVVISAIGVTEVVEQYLPLVRNGGIFNIFGGTPQGKTITLDPRWLHYGEIILTGTFAASARDFQDSYAFVRENAEKVSKVITVRCDLEDVLNAVDRVKKGTALKSVIMFD